MKFGRNIGQWQAPKNDGALPSEIFTEPDDRIILKFRLVVLSHFSHMNGLAIIRLSGEATEHLRVDLESDGNWRFAVQKR